jgi:hypothetical protein
MENVKQLVLTLHHILKMEFVFHIAVLLSFIKTEIVVPVALNPKIFILKAQNVYLPVAQIILI